MKKLLLIIALLPVMVWSQVKCDSIRVCYTTNPPQYGWEKINCDTVKTATFTINKTNQLLVASIHQNHSIIIKGDNKQLNLDFKSGKLIVTGDMEMDEAAKKFMDYCKSVYAFKIDSLENIIKELRKAKP